VPVFIIENLFSPESYIPEFFTGGRWVLPKPPYEKSLPYDENCMTGAAFCESF
jgi:hypothetical protein